MARIVVAAGDLERLLAEETRQVVLRELKGLGFLYVTVDLQGYRTGSLNEGLPPKSGATPPSAGRLAS
jgi:uncharacterized protein